jgi:UDP-N-acetylglucosamine--N-acetylmuramyl-(pentapeptide) pyrophosphoryl-undecaprenol N-acetylglucosamine transferase
MTAPRLSGVSRMVAGAWDVLGMGACENTGVQTLMVAGAGGHLEELHLLRPRLVGISERVTWVTADTPQSRCLLGDEDRIFIPKSMPHDVRATLTTTRRALSVLRHNRWDQVVSTGSLPAVPFLTLARARGIPCHFIESAARVDGPSLSARILERVPGVHRYGQYEWGRHNWSYRGSVFDGFAPSMLSEGTVRRIVVTVGVNGYGFGRLIDAVLRAAPEGAEILWQTGSTDVTDFDIAAVSTLTNVDLFRAMKRADVVIAHAGVGSAIMAMQAGKCPVLVPREREHREHVDDHQHEIASRLARTGLALTCDPPGLDADILAEAARRQVVSNEHASPFVLSTN